MQDEIRVPIATDRDIVAARGVGRALAGRLGFRRTDATLIATAISELGRNILVHAGSGEILLRAAVEDDRCGVVVIARDKGPGIRDVADALRDGYATKNGLGLGLPGSRRIMDDFRIDTEVGRGTTVAMCKWRARDELERLREVSAFPWMSEPPSARDLAPMPRSPSPSGRRHTLGAGTRFASSASRTSCRSSAWPVIEREPGCLAYDTTPSAGGLPTLTSASKGA